MPDECPLSRHEYRKMLAYQLTVLDEIADSGEVLLHETVVLVRDLLGLVVYDGAALGKIIKQCIPLDKWE